MGIPIESKVSRKLIEGLNSFEFNNGVFAYLLTKAPAQIQNRLLDIFVHLIKQWVIEYDTSGGMHDDEVNRLTTAKRLMDTLERWGYDNDYQPKH